MLGYDGCCADAMSLVEETGAVRYMLKTGKAYISYAGGENYPKKNAQETSTAPGWCSMLTAGGAM